jgi:hypothetical protein
MRSMTNVQIESRARPRITGRISTFVAQLVIATAGAMLGGTVIVAIAAVLLATLTKNRSGGNFADHVVEQRIFVLLDEPYFAAPILVGFTLGLLSRRLFRFNGGTLVWVVPAALVIGSAITWRTGGFRPYWRDVWNNYFGSQCGSSECAYEWLLTAPFYTSVAYTLGRIAGNLRRGRKQ